MFRMRFPASHVFGWSGSWCPNTELQLVWEKRPCLRAVQSSWAPRWPQDKWDFMKERKYIFKARKVQVGKGNPFVNLAIHWIMQPPEIQLSHFPYSDVFVYLIFHYIFSVATHIYKLCFCEQSHFYFLKALLLSFSIRHCNPFFCFTVGWYGNGIRNSISGDFSQKVSLCFPCQLLSYHTILGNSFNFIMPQFTRDILAILHSSNWFEMEWHHIPSLLIF